MSRTLGLIAAAALALSAVPASATPRAGLAVSAQSYGGTELARYGCGRGYYPNRNGFCVRSGYVAPRPVYRAPPRVYYGPRYYAPPAVYYRPAPYYYYGYGW